MPLIAGLGIGPILKTIIDSYILRRNFIKDRYYNEKTIIFKFNRKSVLD